MAVLKNPVTGHEINADKDSEEFWKAAGYRDAESKSPAKKTPAKKSASSSKSSK